MGAPSRALPSGRVALMFSDIEGSTALLGRLGDAYGDVLDAHDHVMRAVFADLGGHEFSNEGDAFGAAFSDPAAAASAALTVHGRLRATRWPAGEQVRVRIGLHYGEPKVRGHDYWGEDVHFAARVCAAAHGGQTLLSAAMRAAVPGLDAVSLGHHGLKDFPTPRELFQLLEAGAGAERFPPPRTLSVFHSNLPSIPTPLIGRDEVLADLAQLLAGGRRLVTVIGPGGMGKTRVAIALGERVAERYPDGVAFVALAAADESHVATAVADAVAAPRGGAQDDVAVIEHLRKRQMLLVLDNCEHLVDSAASMVGAVLDGCPGVAVLATSQIPLDLTAEVVHRLGPLSLPPDTSTSHAVMMFVERARSRGAALTLGDDTREAVAELCHLLEGLPLALEIAAARVRTVPVAKLTAALRRDLDSLGRGASDLPERQRTLRAALGWTISLLSDVERDVFIGCAAFAGSWSLEQAEDLFADELDELTVWEAMTRLVDASLFVVAGDGRFGMPERVRRHAEEMLTTAPAHDRRRRRHAEIIGREMREISLQTFVDYRRMLANVVDLLPEALQALSWTKRGAPDLYRHIVGMTAPGLAKVGRLAVVVDDLPGLAPTSDAAEGWDDAAIFEALGHVHAMRWSTETEEEVGLFERAARGYLSFGDPREVVIAGYMAASAMSVAGQEDRANRRMADLQATAGRIEDRRWGDEVARCSVPDGSDDESIAHRRRMLALLGVGTGCYVINHLVIEAVVAGARGHHGRAIAIAGRALREGPRQQLYIALNTIKLTAWQLADAGHDAEAVVLRAGVHACYLARTGAEHGDLIPDFDVAFRAAEARLGDRADHARATGTRLSFDELVDLSIEYAERFGSAASRDDGTQLVDSEPGARAVGAVDPHD